MLVGRSALDWLKLQLDFIDIGMIGFEQAMFGYLVEPTSGKTYYEAIAAEGLRALPAGGER